MLFGLELLLQSQDGFDGQLRYADYEHWIRTLAQHVFGDVDAFLVFAFKSAFFFTFLSTLLSTFKFPLFSQGHDGVSGFVKVVVDQLDHFIVVAEFSTAY